MLTHTLTPAPQADEGAVFERFLSDLASRGRSDRTCSYYRGDWHGLLSWWKQTKHADFSVTLLDAQSLGDWRDALMASGQKAATVNRKVVFARRYVAWARHEGLVADERAAQVELVEAAPQLRRSPQGLSELELKRLRRALGAVSVRDRAIVETVLATGARVSELVELTRADLDLVAGVLRLVGARARWCELSADAAQALGALVDERGDEAGPLFLGERGALTENGVQRIVRSLGATVRLRLSPGILRHTFAASFLNEGGDLVSLADQLGHESLETTRLYTRPVSQPVSVGSRRLELAGGSL